jgi:hypothetical protein
VILLPAPLLPDGDSANSVFPCPYWAGTFFWVTQAKARLKPGFIFSETALTRRYLVAPCWKNTRSAGLEVLKGRQKSCYATKQSPETRFRRNNRRATVISDFCEAIDARSSGRRISPPLQGGTVYFEGSQG